MAPEGDGNPDRIAVLERKIKDLEALVKGLTEELLDVKAIAMRLAKVSEERTRAEVRVTRTAGQAEEPAATVVLRRGQKAGPQAPPAPAKAPEPPTPVPEERVEMIMQPDGTLKPEKRRAEGVIIASAAYAQRAKQRGAPEVKRKSTLIVAEDDDKSETKQ